MKGSEIRSAFLEYFKKKSHTIVSSSSLVPANDPTILFSNAGMNQFKDCFLGTDKRAYSRAVSSQKCLRISGKHNDLENVGVTARHHTFFEMLGNFSFGDYFKIDAIKFGWEFVTEVLKLPKSRLWATVYKEDEEAFKLWSELTDINPDRILKMEKDSNFWAMGDTGPCGPCSELFYYVGKEEKNQCEEDFRKDDGSYLEIWNLVFMQFDRSADGKLSPLPKPSVDTGMGLERAAAVVQGARSNYDTDLLRDIITVCEKLSGFKYDGSSFEVRDLRTDKAYARDVAMRVIADHSRAVAFLIADGVLPGADGRGYVLRRLIRRAVRHGRVLQFKEPFFKDTVKAVVKMMGEPYQELEAPYPELLERVDTIVRVADAEERKFHETLDAGLEILNREVAKLPKNTPFPGQVAFLLHDTYGFPLDLTADALKAYSLNVDVAAFEQAMEAQKHRSRSDRESKGHTYSSVKIEADKTDFLGYESTLAESSLAAVLPSENGEISLIFKATPFYAESGGQVGDTGTIEFKDVRLKVTDTQKVQENYYVHHCQVLEGDFSPKLIGAKASLVVDKKRRERIRNNHSATHIVHAALRNILGSHIKQAGSRVDENTLRFDFSHFESITEAQMNEIQQFIASEIRANHEVHTKVLPLDEARKTGAVALFGEKYGSMVRIVEIGAKSVEFCGGTHVTRSGDIGFVMLANEGGIAAGVRRIECWSGAAAEERLLIERAERLKIVELLKGGDEDLAEKVEKIIARQKALEREIDGMKGKLASASSVELENKARLSPKGIKVIAERVDAADTDTLRSMVDRLRLKLGSGVVALASKQGEQAVVVAGVTADLTANISAGNLVKEASKQFGGRGGGRADFAQAGGLDPARMGDALEKLYQLVG